MISSSEIFSPLQSSISLRNQVQIRWFLILWNRFEVIFHNLLFSPISIINSLSDLINFEEFIKNFLISLWIRPLFTIIPFNSIHFHQIGKFGIIFDTRLCEIDDLAVTSRQISSKRLSPLIVQFYQNFKNTQTRPFSSINFKLYSFIIPKFIFNKVI